MKLDDALAIYLFFQTADTLEKRDERVLDTAWKVIDEHARKAIETLNNVETLTNVGTLANRNARH